MKKNILQWLNIKNELTDEENELWAINFTVILIINWRNYSKLCDFSTYSKTLLSLLSLANNLVVDIKSINNKVGTDDVARVTRGALFLQSNYLVR